MKSIRYSYQTSVDSNICSETLREAMDSQKNRMDFPSHMITGSVDRSHIYIHRANQMASAFEPILFADIHDTQAGSMISGYFKIHWSSKVFSFIALSLITLFTIFFTYLLTKTIGFSTLLAWGASLIPISICLFFWVSILRFSKITDQKTQYVREFIDHNLNKMPSIKLEVQH